MNRTDGKGRVLVDWRPDNREFWESEGKRIASRNLWISIPCLLLSFSVWMVWSVVVAKLPLIGFAYTTDQLFWLAAIPGLSGLNFIDGSQSWSLNATSRF